MFLLSFPLLNLAWSNLSKSIYILIRSYVLCGQKIRKIDFGKLNLLILKLRLLRLRYLSIYLVFSNEQGGTDNKRLNLDTFILFHEQCNFQ